MSSWTFYQYLSAFTVSIPREFGVSHKLHLIPIRYKNLFLDASASPQSFRGLPSHIALPQKRSDEVAGPLS